MKWFRMYADFLDDPKMISLSYEDQRHFIAVLSCKAIGVLDSHCDSKTRDRIVAQKIWYDYSLILELKRRLIDSGLIDHDWQPLAWDKRQFVSDSDPTALDRKRRQREKIKFNPNVTEMSRVTSRTCHGNVTRTDTDTDTDTDTEKAIHVDASASTDKVKSANKVPNCPTEKIVDLYHQHLPTCRQVAVLTTTRKSHIQQRWREMYAAGEFKTPEEGLSVFSDYFTYVSKSQFLTGRSKTTGDRKPFVADLEWLVKPANFAKVIEGKYA